MSAHEHKPAEGDPLGVLVDQHRQFLKFLERRVGNRADAEELLQAAFVRTAEAGTEGLDEESVVTWFYRVLRNALTDHHRRRAAAARGQERLEGEWSDRVDEPELRDAACACVAALLPTLKPEYAEAIRQVDLEEGGIEEVAKREGITAGNARVRLHRARKALRKRVEDTCRTCAEHGCRDCTCGAGTASGH